MRSIAKQIAFKTSVSKALYMLLAERYRFLKSYVKPYKSARVYVRKGISRMEFFDIMNKRKVEYVMLRWWHDLPEIPEGEDMDILISDQDRDLIEDLISYYDNGTGLKCDIYTLSGCKYGSHKSLPYFQANLAHTLIKTRVMYRGAYVPAPLPYFASLAYHALFHKGYTSGLPGFDKTTSEAEHNYSTILAEQAQQLRISIDITAQGIYNWLEEQKFAPADDTLAKLVEIRPELAFLQKSLCSDIRGGDLIVYVVRERLVSDELLHDFTNFLKTEYKFDVLDVRMLSSEENAACTTLIRGGKWDNGPFKYSGGPPVALVTAYDYHPAPLTAAEQKKQSRMTNRNNLMAKYSYRDRLNQIGLKRGHYNGVHSSDNEHDALFYISLLGEEYKTSIMDEVELRRERFTNYWGVKKVLATSAVCKVELIQYGHNLAVKKTFRPGKERYFTRELFAAKELSKEMPFVPPLLEYGDGFIVVPYLQNILDELPDTQKSVHIISKSGEIVRVICSLHARGFALINFTPDNIIITPDDKFFCTNFSYLQKYAVSPFCCNSAYEVAGIPKDFKGDKPENTQFGSFSFSEVWGKYLGSWHNAKPASTQPEATTKQVNHSV